MAITATTLSDSSTAAAGASTIAGASGAASEERFLKLLVTQLNNQDPLNPLDNAELTSQLAQMSTVSGIEKLNTALQSLIDQSAAGQVLQAASLIGRTVLAPGGSVTLKDGAASFGVDVPGAVDSVTVTISDANGNAVRTLALGAQPQGIKTVAWDGRDDSGATLADGRYRVSAMAASGSRQASVNTLVYGAVAGVAQTSTGISLDLGSTGIVDLRSVRSIQ